jgi:cbb3-type cytochrome oxidase subunit 3
MYKHILESAGNINWMAIFALITFVLVFLIGSYTILRTDKEFIDRMSRMPLDDNPNTQTSETTDHHEK